MEGLGLGHGLNILFSAGGGLFNGPPEPTFMDRASGAQAGAADRRTTGYAERVNARNTLLAQRIFAPTMARHFGRGSVSMSHAGNEPVAPPPPPPVGTSSRPSAARPSMRANIATTSSASTMQRRFFRRLNGGGSQNVYFDMRDTRNGPRSRRNRGGGGSRDNSESDMLQSLRRNLSGNGPTFTSTGGNQSASEAFLMHLSNNNGALPFGNETADALEIVDDEDE